MLDSQILQQSTTPNDDYNPNPPKTQTHPLYPSFPESGAPSTLSHPPTPPSLPSLSPSLSTHSHTSCVMHLHAHARPLWPTLSEYFDPIAASDKPNVPYPELVSFDTVNAAISMVAGGASAFRLHTHLQR